MISNQVNIDSSDSNQTIQAKIQNDKQRLYSSKVSSKAYFSSVSESITSTIGTGLLATQLGIRPFPFAVTTALIFWAGHAGVKFWSAFNESKDRLTPRREVKYLQADDDDLDQAPSTVSFLHAKKTSNSSLAGEPEHSEATEGKELYYLARSSQHEDKFILKPVNSEMIDGYDPDLYQLINDGKLHDLNQAQIDGLNDFLQEESIQAALLPDEALPTGARKDYFVFLKYFISDLLSAGVNGYLLGASAHPIAGVVLGSLNMWRNIITGAWSVFPAHARYLAAITMAEETKQHHQQLADLLRPTGSDALAPLHKQPVFEVFFDKSNLSFAKFNLGAFRVLLPPVLASVSAYGAYQALEAFRLFPSAINFLLVTVAYFASESAVRMFNLSVAKKLLRAARVDDFDIEVDYSAVPVVGKFIGYPLSVLFSSTADLPMQLNLFLEQRIQSIRNKALTSLNHLDLDVESGGTQLLDQSQAHSNTGAIKNFTLAFYNTLLNMLSPRSVALQLTILKTIFDVAMYYPAIDSELICLDPSLSTDCYKEGRGKFVNFIFSDNVPESNFATNSLTGLFVLIILVVGFASWLSNKSKFPTYEETIGKCKEKLSTVDKQNTDNTESEHDNVDLTSSIQHESVHHTEATEITVINTSGEPEDTPLTYCDLKSSLNSHSRFFAIAKAVEKNTAALDIAPSS